jgi:phosphotransferase system enzyme I (PtsI)
MVPMITLPGELAQCRSLLAAAVEGLAAEGQAVAQPPLGMMVEVPAAALALEAFDVDFASIGSNDLLQYTLATARDNAAVSALADPNHPGFVRLLQAIVQGAAACGMPLSLCGDLAAQPQSVALLLSAGLRALSVPAAAVGEVKRAIAAWPGP